MERKCGLQHEIYIMQLDHQCVHFNDLQLRVSNRPPQSYRLLRHFVIYCLASLHIDDHDTFSTAVAAEVAFEAHVCLRPVFTFHVDSLILAFHGNKDSCKHMYLSPFYSFVLWTLYSPRLETDTMNTRHFVIDVQNFT